MKKLFLILALTLICTELKAQDLGQLKNETRLNVMIDYSDVLINGLTIEEFEQTENDWVKDAPSIYSKFIDAFNKKVKYLVGGKIKKSVYTLNVHPLVIKRNGDTEAYFTISDVNGNEYYRSQEIKASGGTFGSQLNLMGDGMKSLGKKIGGEVKKLIKK